MTDVSPIPHTAGNAPPTSPVPAGACDCHIHINDPRYPYLPQAALKPPPATAADYRRLQRRLGLERVVVVQPSSYGTDNQCTLDAVAELGPGARAVVVVAPDASAEELQRLDRGGARGVRLNFTRHPMTTLEQVEPLARRVADMGWHLQIHGTAETLFEMRDVLPRLPGTLVFDHMARLPAQAPERHALFPVLASLLDTGRVWVKLSCAYYLDGATRENRYAPAAELVRALVARAPERMVWGTNWPHPSSTAGERPLPDDAMLLDALGDWVGDAARRDRILVENPARLYGFE